MGATKWSPLSRAFFARNKLWIGRSDSLWEVGAAPAIPPLESALGPHPCGALSSAQALNRVNPIGWIRSASDPLSIHLTTAKILSKQWGPPHLSLRRRQRKPFDQHSADWLSLAGQQYLRIEGTAFLQECGWESRRKIWEYFRVRRASPWAVKRNLSTTLRHLPMEISVVLLRLPASESAG